MRPRDIERIANSVAGAFGSPTRASAGCEGPSDPTNFSCLDEFFGCAQAFACGGEGAFKCLAAQFQCEVEFECLDVLFSCDQQVFNTNG